jgi:hypothetical protein
MVFLYVVLFTAVLNNLFRRKSVHTTQDVTFVGVGYGLNERD